MEDQNINKESGSDTVKEQTNMQDTDIKSSISAGTKENSENNNGIKTSENPDEKVNSDTTEKSPKTFYRHPVPALVKPPIQFQKQETNKPVEDEKKPVTQQQTVPERKKNQKQRQNRPQRISGRNGNYLRGVQPAKTSQQQTPQRLNLNLGNKSVSVIIPLYNEEESLVELSIELKKVFERIKSQSYEVIFIDDGSTDSSFARIKEINRMNSRFKCIKFKRNYGKSAALSEGFKAAKCDYIITMDADLQDDPEEIPALILKLQTGYDLVSGWKKVRHDPFIKKYTSRIFNFATSVLVGLKLHDYNCGLKAYVKDVVKNVKVYGEMHRYIPALAYLSGFKVAEIPVEHHARKFGKTKFGASRFVNGLFDLMTVLFTTKYIKRPLHFFGFIGLVSFFAGFGILLYLTILKFFESTPIEGRPLFFVGILFAIVGMQFFSIGLIGEMITKSSVENDNIIIEKTLG